MCMMGGGGTPIGKSAPSIFGSNPTKTVMTTKDGVQTPMQFRQSKDDPNKWTGTALGGGRTQSQGTTLGGRPSGSMQPGVGAADAGGKTLLGA